MFAWFNLLYFLSYLVITFLFDLKFLYQNEHPDDSKVYQGLAAKIVSLCGLQFAWLIFAMPILDVYNRIYNGGFDMELCWALVSLFMLVFLILAIPFTIAYYEADRDERVSKTPPWLHATKHAGIIFSVCVILVGVLFFTCRDLNPCFDGLPDCSTTLPIKFFPLLLFTVFGWFIIVVNLGVGLVSAPLRLIVSFIKRPTSISPEEYHAKKMELFEKIKVLKAAGESLREKNVEIGKARTAVEKWQRQRQFNIQFNKFKQSIQILKQEFEGLNISNQLKGENPLVSAMHFILGIIFLLLSLTWLCHFTLKILITQTIKSSKKPFGFLDEFMVQTSKLNFFLLDLVLYLILNGYLILCTLMGCYTISMRFSFWFQIHPLTPNATHQNAFLFNIGLILVSCPALLQLFQTSFDNYCQNTIIEMLYGDYLMRLPVFSFLFKNYVFVWAVCAICIIAFAYLITHIRDKQAIKLSETSEKKVPKWKRMIAMGNKKKEKQTEASAPDRIFDQVENMAMDMSRSAKVMSRIAGV